MARVKEIVAAFGGRRGRVLAWLCAASYWLAYAPPARPSGNARAAREARAAEKARAAAKAREAAKARAESRNAEGPALFLSCPRECFDDYLRQELSYFDVTNDPYRADLTIVVVRQPAGNGGERFTVSLAPRVPGGPSVAPSSFAVTADTPDGVARKHLLQTILRALRTYLAETPHEAAFELALPKRDGAVLSNLVDRWRYWVIAPEVSAAGDGGSGYYVVDMTGAITIRRITEPQKVRLRASYGRRWSGYLLEDGTRIRGDVDVNVFPYTDNAAKQLRFAYQLGPWANWYLERNRAGLFHEVRGYHALSLIADLNQAWGSLQWIGQVNHFLDDSNRFRLSTGAVISVRLFAGFALSVEGEAALVRDLINLRRRRVTDRELLLWTVEQPTNYRFEAQLVLTYTFGSKHDTIVNPRFARVDLDEE